MRLLIQPGDGVSAIVKGISEAKTCVEIVIFRFDQSEIERALTNAVSRGVRVHALIASKNRAGEENLRKLELRLLGAGVTVARTADDLVRYHSKTIIVDRRELFLLAFNFTHQDIVRSRSFGLIVKNPDVVEEAARLFEADVKRTRYEAGLDTLVVSPVNARQQLAKFIQGAKKELVIYDPRVSDRAMVRLLQARAKAGVRVRVIGRLLGIAPDVSVCRLPSMRLHTRTMVRDGRLAFIGSQSLREAELDARREVGLIFKDPKCVSRLCQTFEDDWIQAERARQDEATGKGPTVKIAKKVAKVVTREMPPVAPIVDGVLQEVVGAADLELVPEEVEEVVRGAVKEAVKEAVRDAVEQVVEQVIERNGRAAG